MIITEQDSEGDWEVAELDGEEEIAQEETVIQEVLKKLEPSSDT